MIGREAAETLLKQWKDMAQACDYTDEEDGGFAKSAAYEQCAADLEALIVASFPPPARLGDVRIQGAMMLAGNKAMVKHLANQATRKLYTVDSMEYIQDRNIHRILISRTIDKADEAKARATLLLDFPTIKSYRVFGLEQYTNMTYLVVPMTNI